MKIKQQLTLGIVIVILQLVVTFFALAWMQNQYEQQREKLQQVHQEQVILYELKFNMSRYLKEMVDLVVLGEEEVEEITYFSDQSSELLSQLNDLTIDSNQQGKTELIEQMNALHRIILRQSQDALSYYQNDLPDKAIDVIEEELEPLLDSQFMSMVDYKSGQNKLLISTLNREINQQINLIAVLFIAFSALMLATTLYFILRLNRRFWFRVEKLSENMKTFAAGDYGTRTDQSGNDEITEVSTVFNDMAHQIQKNESELFEAKTYLQNIIDNMQDLLIVCSDKGLIESVNPATVKLLGYRESELIGLSIANVIVLLDDDRQPVHIKNVVDFLFDSSPVHSRIVKFRNALDDDYFMQFSTSIGIDSYGEKKLFCVAIDISKRISAEQIAYHERDSAQKANQAKSEFLSCMSHELRTPLNAILGFTQLLELNKNVTLDEKASEYITHINSSGEQLLRLVNHLLDLNRIEKGNVGLKIQAVNSTNLIQESVERINISAKEKYCEITLDLDSEHKYIRADKLRLSQVMGNLLDNAIKFNKEGGTVHVSSELQDDNRLRFIVSDTGIGIPSDQLDNVFEAFQRCVPNGVVIPGTGVGLALVKQLVTAMDGEVGVTSAEYQGSQFWFTLPLADKHEIALLESVSDDGTFTPDPQDTPVILYIEDNVANAKLMEHIIATRKDCRLVLAEDGYEGIQLASQLLPSIILLDLNLPDINGFEVLDRLKTTSETKHIPVIAVTAKAMYEDVEEIKKLPFSGYISKPIMIDELNQELDKLLHRPDMEEV